MWLPIRIFQPNREADSEQQRTIRDALAQSLQILRSSPSPDTFLGRKTREPFPQEDEDPRTERSLNSKKLQPPS